MANLEKEMVFEQLKDSSTKRVSVLAEIENIHKDVDKIRKQKDISKVGRAYVEELETKLSFLHDLIKNCIWQAYQDPELYDKMSSYGQIIKNFEIEVIVRQK